VAVTIVVDVKWYRLAVSNVAVVKKDLDGDEEIMGAVGTLSAFASSLAKIPVFRS
jgi:hypothetical protein